MSRRAESPRTRRDRVRLTLGLDGSGAGTRETGVGFLDHMLDLLARHGRLDLDVQVTGDLQTGPHHTVEDTGLALGQALDAGARRPLGIPRYGHAVVPMDEARAMCAIDVSGPAAARLRGRAAAGRAPAGFDHELAEEFFRAVASTAKLTLHLSVEAGTQRPPHDRGGFKAFARALRAGGRDRPDGDRACPSTKGTLTE